MPYNKYCKFGFDLYFTQIKIEHITVVIEKLTTLGMIERGQHTCDVEILWFRKHEGFIKYYNNKRVHISLTYMTPRQVYSGRSVTHVVRYYY